MKNFGLLKPYIGAVSNKAEVISVFVPCRHCN